MHKQKQPRDHKVGFWEMIRDVLNNSINKGQFPPVAAAMIFVAMIYRMPPEDVSRLMFEILADLKTGYLIGYAIGIILLMGWFMHVKWQRRIIAHEMRRIGLEKSEVQAVKLAGDITTSE